MIGIVPLRTSNCSPASPWTSRHSRASRIAHTSEYHLRRMFSALSGMPLSEYVRRRRLTLATAEIVAGDSSVLDVAVRYGYQSADAFTRAFRTLHGFTPTQARMPGAVLRSQPRMSFHLTIEGSTDMRHRIENLPALRLVGLKTRVPLVYSGPNEAIIAFERSIAPEVNDRLLALNDIGPRGILSVSTSINPDRAEGSELDYWHAVTTTAPADEFESLDVAASLWAVFEDDGAFPEVLQNLWAQSFSEWFPSNPYRVVPGPELLRSEPSADYSSGRGELWIPVERESR